MKKIFGALIALYSAFAFSATTVPVQLLNPTGSSSGQAIVSTGASSAPAWGGIGVNGIAAIAANTVLANATGSSAAPTAFAVPSCSAAGNALNWTSGTGFTCATGYAPLASPNFTGTATAVGLTVSGGFVPSQTSGIVGTTTNNNVAAGSVGEYVTGTTNSTSMSSGVAGNCTSASLTSGDWDVSGSIQFVPAAGTTVSAIASGISTTSATLGALGSLNTLNATLATSAAEIQSTPVLRLSLASTTTVFLVGQTTFGTSTMTCNGFIRARRVR